MFADLGIMAIHTNLMLEFLILSRDFLGTCEPFLKLQMVTLRPWSLHRLSSAGNCGHPCRLRHGSFAADGLKHDLAGDTKELKSLFHQLAPG